MVGPSYVNQATSMFSYLEIKAVSGSRFLGGFVGERSMASDYNVQKVKMWVDCVQCPDLCNLIYLFATSDS